jgi:hypothetical protein
MRRTKDMLRLRFELGLGLRQIDRGLSISVGTVHDYLQRAEAAGIKWPLPEASMTIVWKQLCFPNRPHRRQRGRRRRITRPSTNSLQKPHVTSQLLWEEYQVSNPDGYRHSRFCELYQRWRRKQFFFGFLPLPILSRRALPYRLGIRTAKVTEDSDRADHSLDHRLIGRLLKTLTRRELAAIARAGRCAWVEAVWPWRERRKCAWSV